MASLPADPGAGAVRVAVLVHDYPELSQTFVTSEAQALREAGCDVRVEAARRARTPNPSAPADLPVAFREDDGRVAAAGALLRLVARHPVRVLADARDRRRWSREETVSPLRSLALPALRLRHAGTDHLHVHFAAGMSLDGLRLGALLGVPCSVTAHAYEIYTEPRNLQDKLRRAAFVTSGSDYTVAGLRALLSEHERARVHKVVMGVDPDVFRRSAPYPGGRSVLAVGRLVEKKGFAVLLDAVARLERSAPLDRVVIVGDGPLRDALIEQRDRLGLAHRVELAGARPPEAVRSLLDRADVLAMPCVVAADGDRDSMPVVVKEALAMEVPVVASDAVGLPEVVDEGWGRLAPTGDAAALAAALEELLALPPGERAAMGRAGRAFVAEHCDAGAEGRRLAGLIRAAIRA